MPMVRSGSYDDPESQDFDWFGAEKDEAGVTERPKRKGKGGDNADADES